MTSRPYSSPLLRPRREALVPGSVPATSIMCREQGWTGRNGIINWNRRISHVSSSTLPPVPSTLASLFSFDVVFAHLIFKRPLRLGTLGNVQVCWKLEKFPRLWAARILGDVCWISSGTQSRCESRLLLVETLKIISTSSRVYSLDHATPLSPVVWLLPLLRCFLIAPRSLLPWSYMRMTHGDRVMGLGTSCAFWFMSKRMLGS